MVLYLTVSAFAEMDEDEDGEITQEEFIKVNASSNSNERILQLFSSNMYVFCTKKSGDSSTD